MDLYMVVEIDDEGMFLSDPDFFDLRSEADKAKQMLLARKPSGAVVILHCREVD